MKRQVQGLAIILLCTFLWALNGNLGAWLFDYRNFDPSTLVVARLLVTGLTTLGINLLKNGDQALHILRVRSNYRHLLIYSFMGVALMQTSYFSAILHSNAPTSTLLQYLGIFLVTGYLAIRTRTIPSLPVFFALGLASLGVGLLVTHGDPSSLVISPTALTWGLLSALAFSFSNLAPIKLQAYYPTRDIIGPSMTLAGLLVLILTRPDFSQATWDLKAVLALAFCIFGGTLAPFTLFMEGQRRLGAQLASVFSLTEAIFSTLIAVLVYGASFIGLDYISMAMILVALLILSRDQAKAVGD